jgi:RND family efflux transporter MFP subunit
LKTINVDVGDRVRGGDVVATIESPETDRALAGAKADYDNKQLTSTRVAQLLDKKMVSPQEADQARTEASVADERLEALREQQGYETLRAPFSGRVTARFADAGALAQNAASSQTSALPIVTVSRGDSLRVLVYLDQSDATNARPGTPATITMTEHPGVQIPAHVTRVAGELDPKTRKMLTELDIENSRGLIVPGSFVNVRIDFPATPAPQAPVEALVVRNGTTSVGMIDAESRVHLTPVTIASNDGKLVTFGSGVAVGARVALNLGSAVADGDRIQLDSSSTTVASDTQKPNAGTTSGKADAGAVKK